MKLLKDDRIRLGSKSDVIEITFKFPDLSSEKEKDQANPFVRMQTIKRALPYVVIQVNHNSCLLFHKILISLFLCKGLPTVNRAVINDIENENRLNLLVEGNGLREVMGMEGKLKVILLHLLSIF